VTRIAQVSGQSCGHTALANSAGAFIEKSGQSRKRRQMTEFYYVGYATDRPIRQIVAA
jgi:hypothetical protein